MGEVERIKEDRKKTFFEKENSFLMKWGVLMLGTLLVTSAFAGAKKPDYEWKLSDITGDETVSGMPGEAEQERKQVEGQIAEYLALSEGKLSKERQKELEKSCAEVRFKNENPLCPLLLDYLSPGKKRKVIRKSHAKNGWSSQEFAKAMKKSDFSYFYSAQESTLKVLLANLEKKKATEKFIEATTATGVDCPPTGFLLHTGLAMERDLPDEKKFDAIKSLYSKALSCGNNLATVQAGFRLGLFHILEESCEKAETVFSQVPEVPNSPDYQIRINYWRYFCAKKTNNTTAIKRIKRWLLKEYPLSLHTLLVYADSDLKKDLPFDKKLNPEVQFRSVADPGLNTIIRMVEGLQSKQLYRAAFEVMSSHSDRVLIAELPIQWYWLILLKRTGNYAPMFTFLANIYRGHPQMIAQDTLEIMYPTEYLEQIEELKKEVDSHLILSLMRQESAFNPKARSRTGARGLMQIQPSTARYLGSRTVSHLYEPKHNIKLGVKYLLRLFDQFEAKTELALAAYNAGPGKIRYWSKRFPTENSLLFLDLLPIRETRDYVTSVARNYFWYKKLYESGTETNLKPGLASLWGTDAPD